LDWTKSSRGSRYVIQQSSNASREIPKSNLGEIGKYEILTEIQSQAVLAGNNGCCSNGNCLYEAYRTQNGLDTQKKKKIKLLFEALLNPLIFSLRFKSSNSSRPEPFDFDELGTKCLGIISSSGFETAADFLISRDWFNLMVPFELKKVSIIASESVSFSLS
jgi:hypothetical protein